MLRYPLIGAVLAENADDLFVFAGKVALRTMPGTGSFCGSHGIQRRRISQKVNLSDSESVRTKSVCVPDDWLSFASNIAVQKAKTDSGKCTVEQRWGPRSVTPEPELKARPFSTPHLPFCYLHATSDAQTIVCNPGLRSFEMWRYLSGPAVAPRPLY